MTTRAPLLVANFHKAVEILSNDGGTTTWKRNAFDSEEFPIRMKIRQSIR